MTRRLTDQLLDQTVQAARLASNDESATLRFGTVKDVQGRKVTVELGGGQVAGVPCLSSYTPQVGDVAWLLHQGPTLVALGTQ